MWTTPFDPGVLSVGPYYLTGKLNKFCILELAMSGLSVGQPYWNYHCHLTVFFYLDFVPINYLLWSHSSVVHHAHTKNNNFMP